MRRQLWVALLLHVAAALARGEERCEVCVDGAEATASASCAFVLRPLPAEKKKQRRRCYGVDDTRPQARRGFRAFLFRQPWYVYVLGLWVLSAVQKYFD